MGKAFPQTFQIYVFEYIKKFIIDSYKNLVFNWLGGKKYTANRISMEGGVNPTHLYENQLQTES